MCGASWFCVARVMPMRQQSFCVPSVLPSLSRLSSDVSISVRQALAGVLHSLFRYRSQKPGGTAALLTILSRLLQVWVLCCACVVSSQHLPFLDSMTG